MRFRTERLGALFKYLDEKPAVFLVGYTVIYLLSFLIIDRYKLIWDDEFFTLYISASPTFSSIMSALMTGADQHPPLFYFITHTLFRLLGVHHGVLRLPALVGFWGMTLSIYGFVRHRTSPAGGIIALLFSLQTGAFLYAIEARGYGLVLGFSAFALLCWQRAAEKSEKRIGWLLGLAVGLALAVSSHYYAILFLIALSAGEVCRNIMQKKLDLQVWLSFSAAVFPLGIFYPIIRNANNYSKTFWASPKLSSLFGYYYVMFADLVLAGVFFGVLLLLYVQYKTQKAPPEVGKEHAQGHSLFSSSLSSQLTRMPFVLYESITLSVLVLLPCAAMLFAFFVTNAFHPRYVIIPVIGGSIIAALLSYSSLKRAPFAGTLLVAALLGAFIILRVRDVKTHRGQLANTLHSAQFLDQLPTGELPIVVSEVTVFHKLSFYGPPRLARRLVYLAHPESSVNFLGHDTIDKCLLALREWFPLNTQEYESYVATHSQFLVYGGVNDWSWLASGLLEKEFTVEVVGRNEDLLLFLVKSRSGNLALANNTEEKNFSNNLESKSPLSIEASMCHILMNDMVCDDFYPVESSLETGRNNVILKDSFLKKEVEETDKSGGIHSDTWLTKVKKKSSMPLLVN